MNQINLINNISAIESRTQRIRELTENHKELSREQELEIQTYIRSLEVLINNIKNL
jgi:hypothetical protein